ncbi:UNVERIFIED_CONTAM: hypothetical protein FKN15_044927 [Acipenser sinensis]
MEEIRASPDYNWFRSTVSLKKIIVDDDDSKVWSLYDAGPKVVRCPIIFLPPVSGTSDVFFQQILALTGWGYRVISLQYPVYWDLLEFCDGFRKLLDHLQLDKKIVLGNFATGPVDVKMADAIDFMVDRLESLGQSELASRLTLNCQNSYVEPHKIKDIAVTIMDIHLRQFHGTRYAAIDPAMVSAEELEVQKSSLNGARDSDEEK